MYEDVTFELILDRMLGRVPNTVDKREGSIIYDALAPAAAEMAKMYIEGDMILNETFADTASRGNLIKRAAERGVRPSAATFAVLKGEFNKEVPIGSRFGMDGLNYRAFERMADGIFKLRCETAGRAGNVGSGNLLPIDYIDGLTKAELTEVLIPGEDEEETEHLRRRYFSGLDSQAFGGNLQDYKEKTNAIAGVGGVKVYPAWNGGGTVKLIFINSEFEKPSEELVGQVQTEIDPMQNQGKGVGIAPIGHVVTVQGVTETAVTITAKITYQADWSWEAVKPYATAAIDEYFEELAQSWADEDVLIVRVSQIETRLLNQPGVVDITGTVINGVEQNFALDAGAIPKRGEMHGA